MMDLMPIAPPQEEEGQKDAPRKDTVQTDTAQKDTLQTDNRGMIFEPNKGRILDALLPKYLENQCFTAHLNTEAGEHGARMVAMDGATKNAREMISSLTLQYNRLRQAAITRELIEIISGAESL